ncbi:MAG: glycerol-3-phosphate 1-O-acyltransferase PlsY [Spirochaetota bacterium]|nr:glycerol-3-phosphate 1-O-acyltransferase PlsY [Spirochaetota bacterium]
MIILLISVISYLAGSLPVGYIITKLKTNKDIRNIGSGNIGASNVKRILGLRYALLVVFLDAVKAVLPLYIVKYHLVFQNQDLINCIAAFFLVIGHIYSIFLKLEGGKGVATYIGVMAVLLPLELSIFLAIYLILLILTRHTSMSSIIDVSLFPFIVLIINGITQESAPYLILSVFLAIIIIIKHKDNIRRLRQGKEPKFILKDKINRIYAK